MVDLFKYYPDFLNVLDAFLGVHHIYVDPWYHQWCISAEGSQMLSLSPPPVSPAKS